MAIDVQRNGVIVARCGMLHIGIQAFGNTLWLKRGILAQAPEARNS